MKIRILKIDNPETLSTVTQYDEAYTLQYKTWYTLGSWWQWNVLKGYDSAEPIIFCSEKDAKEFIDNYKSNKPKTTAKIIGEY